AFDSLLGIEAPLALFIDDGRRKLPSLLAHDQVHVVVGLALERPLAVEGGGEALEVGLVLALVAGRQRVHLWPENALELLAITIATGVVQRFGSRLGSRELKLP